MPIDPQIQAIVDMTPESPPLDTLDVATLRASVREASVAVPPLEVPLGKIYDRTIPGPAGTLKTRVYQPEGSGPFPLLVYFHGGGWVVGDLDTQDSICRGLCHDACCVVMSVDYRLAPEHRFPAAADDAYGALLWAAEHAGEIAGDSSRIAIGGDSAGALLCGGLSLRVRDQGGPNLCGQVLFYGSMVYEIDAPTASLEEFKDGPWLRKDDIVWFWRQYLPDVSVDQRNPLACPMYANSHADLPPAFVGTAECDPIRDSAEAYGNKLKQAGVAVEMHRYPGMPHGFVSMVSVVPAARQAVSDAGTWLCGRFAEA
ncbi:MAG: alpha/beta hydrolase [Halieaceae bacterium]|nr:alpha/beta hydrolase [Halieaceae bacterium]MCP5163856.1 alpha/beta hydrolase [Pseudomonadales bacterium]MCP5202906.1 alpha/beta hydrolase [Pseudomonadales bacterium]